MQVQRTRLFEIFNGHPQVNNVAAAGAGLEEIWDRSVSSGRLMYGVAVDDAHHFKRPGDPLAAGPGRGWIYVRAERLDAARVGRGDGAGGLLLVYRCRARLVRGDGVGHHAWGEGNDLQPVPRAVRRPERPGSFGADDADGFLHVQGR